jgi:hypothetical protein
MCISKIYSTKQHPSLVCSANCHAIFAKQNPSNCRIILNGVRLFRPSESACQLLERRIILELRDIADGCSRDVQKASRLNKAWWRMMITFGKVRSRANTSSLRINPNDPRKRLIQTRPSKLRPTAALSTSPLSGPAR